MSLYYEASPFYKGRPQSPKVLLARINSSKNLKNKPALIYALVVETQKWSSVLEKVIANAETPET